MTQLDAGPVQLPAASGPWRLATRIAFRYCVSYFGLYVLCTQMISGLIRTVNWGAPALGARPPMSSLTMWVIRHGFHDNWFAAAAQVLVGAYLVALVLYGAAVAWRGPFAGGAPKPPLYGVWTIDKMTVGGVERPPLVNDGGRWRRLVVQDPTRLFLWRMDDTALAQFAKVDMTARTITLSHSPKDPPASHFTFEQSAPDQLVLDGDFEGRRMHLETHLIDPQTFLLVSRGFHWIQEAPFNR